MAHKLAVAALFFAAALTTTASAGTICRSKSAPLTGSAATARNLATVQAIYAAFGKGDVPAILGCVAPAARWEAWSDNRAQAAGVPWLLERKGPEGVGAFFAYVGKWKVNSFAVKNVMAAGSNVAAEVEVDFSVVQTGGRIRDQEIHYWTLDDRGHVTGMRHYGDTAKHIAAARRALTYRSTRRTRRSAGAIVAVTPASNRTASDSMPSAKIVPSMRDSMSSG